MDNRIALIKEKIKSNGEDIEYFQGLIKRIENNEEVGFSNDLDVVENDLFYGFYDLKHSREFYYIEEEPEKEKITDIIGEPIIGNIFMLEHKKRELEELLATVKSTLTFNDENRFTLNCALINFNSIAQSLNFRDPELFKDITDISSIKDAEYSIKNSYDEYRNRLINTIELTIACIKA